jgi:hypothetical protein
MQADWFRQYQPGGHPPSSWQRKGQGALQAESRKRSGKSRT